MIIRFPGAALRGLLVAMLVATPSMLLPVKTTDATEMVALLALLAGLLTFFVTTQHVFRHFLIDGWIAL